MVLVILVEMGPPPSGFLVQSGPLPALKTPSAK
jgi:hypothetical protein